MAHYRLKLVLTLFLGSTLFMMGCVKDIPVEQSVNKTYLESTLPPQKLLVTTEQFLEWQKGYEIEIRDHARGLLVTGWLKDSPVERHQITVRVNSGIKGSVISAHFTVEYFEQNNWKVYPNDGRFEAAFLQELDDYLSHSSK